MSRGSFRAVLRRAFGHIDERAYAQAREMGRSLAERGMWVAPNLTDTERAYVEEMFKRLRAEHAARGGAVDAPPRRR